MTQSAISPDSRRTKAWIEPAALLLALVTIVLGFAIRIAIVLASPAPEIPGECRKSTVRSTLTARVA